MVVWVGEAQGALVVADHGALVIGPSICSICEVIGEVEVAHGALVAGCKLGFELAHGALVAGCKLGFELVHGALVAGSLVADWALVAGWLVADWALDFAVAQGALVVGCEGPELDMAPVVTQGARVYSIGSAGGALSRNFGFSSSSAVSVADHRNMLPKGKCCTTGSLPSTSLSYILSIP